MVDIVCKRDVQHHLSASKDCECKRAQTWVIIESCLEVGLHLGGDVYMVYGDVKGSFGASGGA